MADDKKNISDAGKADEPPKPGKVEPVKADSPVHDQPAPVKAEAPVIEDASKVVASPTAEQPAPAGKEAPKDKDAPAPSMEGAPQPGKDEKQSTIHGMGDPAPAGKVVDFTAARDGATKGKPPERDAAPDKGKQTDKVKDAAKPRRGRPPKADKTAPDKAKPQPRDKMSQSKAPAGKGAPATAEAPAATEPPPTPRDATRGVKEADTVLLPRLRQDCSAAAKKKLHEEKARLMRGKLGPGNAHISRLSGAAWGVGNMFSLTATIQGKCFPHFAPGLRDILSQSPGPFCL